MIQTKKDLAFYIAADRIMNGFTVRRSLKDVFILGGGQIANHKILEASAQICLLL